MSKLKTVLQIYLVHVNLLISSTSDFRAESAGHDFSYQITERDDPAFQNASSDKNISKSNVHFRRRRFDYEDTHNWNYDDDSVDYDDEQDEQKKQLKKLMLNWEKIAVRLIIVITIVSMICFCCWFACERLCTNVICPTVKNVINCCGSLCKRCCNPEYDEVYEHISAFTDKYGFKLDYATYKHFKNAAKDKVCDMHGIDPSLRGMWEEDTA